MMQGRKRCNYYGGTFEVQTRNLSPEVIMAMANVRPKVLIFDEQFKGHITAGCIPDSVKELIFYCKFTIDQGVIPVSVKKIKFEENSKFNDFIDWPVQLKEVSFEGSFNHECIENLPDTVEKMYFGSEGKFNYPMLKWPKNLKTLHFDYYAPFNHPLVNLPETLVELQLGDYNHPIDHLSDNLKVLVLGEKFDYPIIRLPQNLEELVIGNENWDGKFNHPLPNLPSNLRHLTVCNHNYTHSFPLLPTNLETLFISKNYSKGIALNEKVKVEIVNIYNLVILSSNPLA